MRLFFALWPDSDSRARFADAAAHLGMDHATLIAPENYHLTLAFVGEVVESRLSLLRQIGGEQRAGACTIKFDAYDYWPAPQVLVAVTRETPSALLELCARLHERLALHGAQSNPENPPQAQATPFRAHVTLARKVAQAPVLKAMSPIWWRASSFSLVRSDTGGVRAVYTVVDTWSLLDEMEKR
jgi:2'-5' RNA ligase